MLYDSFIIVNKKNRKEALTKGNPYMYKESTFDKCVFHAPKEALIFKTQAEANAFISAFSIKDSEVCSFNSFLHVY